VAGSLGEAVSVLEADNALCDAVGAQLCEHHIFLRRAEVEKTRGLEGDALRDYYIWYV
jgi:glutamine synthetase